MVLPQPSGAQKRSPVTVEDYLALPDDARMELIRGTLIQKAGATGKHAGSQLATGGTLREFYQRGRNGGPGGWRFFTEMTIQFGPEVFVPDVSGQRLSARTHGRDGPRNTR